MAARGNPNQLGINLVEIRPSISRFLAAQGASGAEIDDMIHDLYLKTFSVADSVSTPTGYLYRMAHNLLIDRKKAARRREKREAEWADHQSDIYFAIDAAPSPERIVIACDYMKAVQAAIDALPRRAALVFRLFRISELSHAQIATQLGISVSAVEKHLNRAYRGLREFRERHDLAE
ncbi:RNA polymerase sigma factor [Flavisphingomonas formosensis]|uniref:RNA polymerase sigma factor n=1 Tax=Flavisphingomonas formosensis TaxID=861534 RepID=UPI0012FA4F4B|nr:RNA polymerase sigma factor [Sphingomonas formosensis]